MNKIERLALTDSRFTDIKLLTKYAKQITTADGLAKAYKHPTKIIYNPEILCAVVDDILYYDKEFTVDLETTGLDPYNDVIVGVCIGTEELRYYVPVNHTDYNNRRLSANLDEQEVAYYIKKLETGGRWVNHNCKFDYKFLKWHWDVTLTPYWDTLVSGHLLNENEQEHSLKYLHARYISKDKDKQSFKDLFKDTPFNYVPIELAGIYGCNDVTKSMELFKFHKEHIEKHQGVKNVFDLIEMPLITVLADMELEGILLDEEKRQQLEVDYGKIVDQRFTELHSIIDQMDMDNHAELNRLLDAQAKNKKGRRLNLNSAPQKKIFFFEILGLPPVQKGDKEYSCDKKSVDLWLDMKLKPHQRRFLEAYQEWSKMSKLHKDFIVGIKSKVNPKTGAVHTNFKAQGTVTGRFSSSEPNLQQIPSRDKQIRKMFKARDGHVLISSDYSTIEPRVLAWFSQDAGMIEAFETGRDVYATMASMIFDKPYENCLEFHPETGVKQPEGKELRTQVKSVLLGIMYDRGASSIAEQFGKTKKWATGLVDKFYDAYPNVKLARIKNIYKAEKLGYVETLFGRKRRLPEMKRFKNSPAYASATRQCLNSVIQGTSADIMKLAMVVLANNEEFNKTGAKILLTVHDELLVECPEKYAERCGEIVSQLMKETAYNYTRIKQKCDVEITKVWTGESVI